VTFDPGTTGTRSDTKWLVTAKWLQAVQNAAASPNTANNPKRTDTRRTLLDKIAKAKAGL